MRQQALAAKGAAAVVITLGAEAVLCLSQDHRRIRFACRHHTSRRVDTSGAGDVFCGCLAGGLAKGMSVTSALKLALAAAAVAVTRPGTLCILPHRV